MFDDIDSLNTFESVGKVIIQQQVRPSKGKSKFLHALFSR